MLKRRWIISKENQTNEDVINYLSNFIKEIKSYISLDCVILFGSRVREDFLPHSELDLIFIGDFKEKFINRSSKIYEKHDHKLGLDAFCYTPKEFDTMFIEGIVSILDAVDEGICLLGQDFYKNYKRKIESLKKKDFEKIHQYGFYPIQC